MADCPDIYINPTYWTTPHAGEYGNLSIDVGPGGTTFPILGPGDPPYNIRVTVQNHGLEDSPTSLLQLWCSDPSTSFAAVSQVDVDKVITVPGGDGVGTDGSTPENFAFSPSSLESGTNGGHVCLLAQVANTANPADMTCTAQGHASFAAAATDARSAIRNIHVYDPAAPAPHKHTPLPPHGAGFEMSFAFAAANNRADVEDTRLEVRALDPSKDRERLATLVSDRAVYHALARRRIKFAVPEAVFLAEGRERVVLPRPVNVRKAGDTRNALPRIGRLGPLSEAAVKRLQLPGTKRFETKAPIDMKLAPGEMRQTIVTVRPCQKEDVAYVVAVDHEAANGRPLGGLVLVFVKPHDFF
jgi:hypothetical protein